MVGLKKDARKRMYSDENNLTEYFKNLEKVIE